MQDLEKLHQLAQEPSSERRRELLRELTDLFVADPNRFEAAEKDHVSKILGTVAYQMEQAVRQQLAARLAEVPGAPRDLVQRLAKDEIDVARPLLRQSAALGDDDLIAVVRERGQAHMLAISQRQTVSADVADALVERGDDQVLVSLIENDGASLSAGAMTSLVERSTQAPDLQAPLLHRADLPADLMHQMYWFVTSALRHHIVAATDQLDEAEIDRILHDSEAAILAQAEREESDLSTAERFVRRKEQSRELNENLAVQLLRDGRMAEFIAVFARLTDLDVATARRVLFDPAADSVAIAAKAADFTRQAFSTILLLTDRGTTRSATETTELLALYDQVPAKAAQRTMRFWRLRQARGTTEARVA